MAPATARATSAQTAAPVAQLFIRGLFEDCPPYVWVFVVGLAASIFTGQSQQIGLPLSLDRLILPAALVLFAADRRRRRLSMTPWAWLALAYLGCVVASMVLFDTLGQRSGWFALLDRDAIPMLFFALGAALFDTERARDLLLKTLCLVGLYLGVTAVLEFVAPGLVWPRYIANADLGLHFGRARGPFLGAEGMGLACALTAYASLLLVGRRLPGWSWLARLSATVALMGVALALTRSIWIGVAAAAVVTLVLEPRTRRFLPHAVAAGLAAVAAIAATPWLSALLEARASASAPVYDRLASNRGALELLADQPLTGIGWRRFYPYGSEWMRQGDQFPMNNAIIEVHNVLLSRAAELGLPTAALFLGLIVFGPLAHTLRRTSGPLRGWKVVGAAAIVTWLVAGLFGPLATPFPNYVAWLLAGVAAPGVLRLGGRLDEARDARLMA